jgi:hypothetical protein
MLLCLFNVTACKKKIPQTQPKVTIHEARSLTAYAGKDRVKLLWELPGDTKVSRCTVYWNNGKDSISVNILPGISRDSLIIGKLQQGSYTFYLAVFDSKGNSSDKVSVNGNAYGEKYADSLKNRSIRKADYNVVKGAVDITWNDAAKGAVGTEVFFKDSTGELRNVFVPVYYTNSTIKSFNTSKDSVIRYRTLFLPDITAIDTFYTSYDTLKITPPADESGNAGYTIGILKADGKTDTYTLINSVLGGTAEETPDCSHPSFGPHIRQEFNKDLNEPVFAFYLHVTPDNDRCVNFDRQRCEIKTYGPSPDSLKAFNGDQMIFKWKFRLDDGFQPSYSFTHIHQLKAGDGPNDGSPIITITPRYANPEKLQIIHNGDTKNTTLGTVKEVDLAPFKGTWIQAVEKVAFGSHGTYSLVLKKISDGTVLLSYSNNDMDLWRTGSTFVRPKWGIYRSLNHPEQLRDEKVLFADFFIEKKK